MSFVFSLDHHCTCGHALALHITLLSAGPLCVSPRRFACRPFSWSSDMEFLHVRPGCFGVVVVSLGGAACTGSVQILIGLFQTHHHVHYAEALAHPPLLLAFPCTHLHAPRTPRTLFPLRGSAQCARSHTFTLSSPPHMCCSLKPFLLSRHWLPSSSARAPLPRANGPITCCIP